MRNNLHQRPPCRQSPLWHRRLSPPHLCQSLVGATKQPHWGLYGRTCPNTPCGAKTIHQATGSSGTLRCPHCRPGTPQRPGPQPTNTRHICRQYGSCQRDLKQHIQIQLPTHPHPRVGSPPPNFHTKKIPPHPHHNTMGKGTPRQPNRKQSGPHRIASPLGTAELPRGSSRGHTTHMPTMYRRHHLLSSHRGTSIHQTHWAHDH
jgi:hypothetical protein